MLHLTKCAVGCSDVETLTRALARRWGETECFHFTRMMPKRAAELVGGSFFWIIGHRLVCRQEIQGLEMAQTSDGPKCRIALRPGPVLVEPVHRRAHQGWRYLDPADAPPDLAPGVSDAMPSGMVRELQSLWLL